ncbi:peptidase [Mycolicibacterium phlei]|uniref:peptidase n=1 Tax=Mycolicibacterium phlei TaxID=1771 RepID=UPI0037CCAFC4
MRRSTTSAVTDPGHGRRRARLAALLIAELVCAVLLLDRADTPRTPTEAAPAAPAALTGPITAPAAGSREQPFGDGRTAVLIGLGGAHSEDLLARIAADLDDAADAVTAFWGPDWPRRVTVVAAGTDAQFAAVGGGDTHTAATTTDERIMFAPGAARISASALRIVLRHELFHYAARTATATDAPRWLTEGVADFVARPDGPAPGVDAARLPGDADLTGPDRAAAYDRAWWFARFVAERYGADALRRLYTTACGPGHPDVATAVRATLATELSDVLAEWQRWTG